MSSRSPTVWADDPELSLSLSMLLSELGDSSRRSTSMSISNDLALPQPFRRKSSSHNASRERLQKELVALRRLAPELERELDALKLKELESTPKFGAGNERDAEQVYKAMAKRQRQARKRAELLNRKLHVMLADQNAVMQELFDVVSKHRCAQQILFEWSSSYIASVPKSGQPSRQDLLKRTLNIGKDWNEPFREYLGSAPSDWNIIRDNGREIIIEVHATSTHPFAYHEISAQLWSHWKHACVLEDNYTVNSVRFVRSLTVLTNKYLDQTELPQENRAISDMIGFTFRAASVRDGVTHAIEGDGARHAVPHVGKGSVFASSSYGIYYATDTEQTRDQIALFRDLWVHVKPGDVASVTNVRYVARGYLNLAELQDHQMSYVDELTSRLRWFIQQELRCALDDAETALLHPPNQRRDITV